MNDLTSSYVQSSQSYHNSQDMFQVHLLSQCGDSSLICVITDLVDGIKDSNIC